MKDAALISMFSLGVSTVISAWLMTLGIPKRFQGFQALVAAALPVVAFATAPVWWF